MVDRTLFRTLQRRCHFGFDAGLGRLPGAKQIFENSKAVEKEGQLVSEYSF